MSEPLAAEPALIAFLEDPASYPHRPASVQLVQTHISFVALAGEFVYKVKKPVSFGFLDFSTLAQRRHFCEQEVLLNRRLCAGIYEGVVPIREGTGGLTFAGDGTPVDYAVKMRRMTAGGFLDARLERGEAGSGDIDRVARKLVAFYRGQTPTPEVAAWGGVDRLRISTDENFAQTAPFVGETLPWTTQEALRSYTEAFYTCNATLLEGRATDGHVLDCHGDLRAEHVHLSEDGVCIYDCIEFNERFRFIDVASDLAFLAMDLRYRGHVELGRRLVRRVGEALADPGLARLLPFYGCYRAYVRGKVALMRSEDAKVPPADRNASREAARRHFQLALSYAVGGDGAAVVVVMGRVGTGKSTVAGRLAEVMGWEVASSDRLRKQRAGAPLHRRGTADERARLYDPASTAWTYAALREAAVANARAGRGTVLDATYSQRLQREALRVHLADAGLPCLFVELTAPDAVLRARLQARETQQDVVSDARLEDFAALSTRYEPPGEDENAHAVIVSATGTREQTVLAALTSLTARTACQPPAGPATTARRTS